MLTIAFSDVKKPLQIRTPGSYVFLLQQNALNPLSGVPVTVPASNQKTPIYAAAMPPTTNTRSGKNQSLSTNLQQTHRKDRKNARKHAIPEVPPVNAKFKLWNLKHFRKREETAGNSRKDTMAC